MAERVAEATPTTAPPARVRFVATKRLLMVAATAFFAINIWTGVPLFALWVGSEAVGQRLLSMAAVGVVVIVLAVLEVAIAFAILWVDREYKQLTGHPLRENRLTWLRPMNNQGETVGLGVPLDLLERIVMVSVYLAVLGFVVFLVFFASASPLPS